MFSSLEHRMSSELMPRKEIGLKKYEPCRAELLTEAGLVQWVDEFGQGQKVLVGGSHLPLFFPTSFASPVHDSVQFIWPPCPM